MNYLKKAARTIGDLLRNDRTRKLARPGRRPGSTRLGAEYLEAREVPAVTIPIDGTSGMDTFEFDRTAADRVLITVNGAVTFDGVVTQGDRFVLRGLGQIDQFNINSTPVGVSVLVRGGADVDIIDVGDGDLDAIRGRVVVDGGGGADTLRIHDMFDDTDNTFAVSSTRVDRNNSAPVVHNGVELVQVFGGTGTQVFNVASTAAGVTTNLFGNQQDDTFNLSPVAQNLGLIDGTLVLDGSGGSDTVNFRDTSRATLAAYNITGSSLTRGGMAIVTAAQFETVNVQGSATARSVFNITGTSGLAQTTIIGGRETDVFNVGEGFGDLDLIGGPLNLRGGRGVDGVNINDSADTQDRTIRLSAGSVDRDDAGLISFTGAEALSITAGTGDDRLVLNGVPTIPVDLEGGGGSDTLAAPNQANTFRVTGTNAGTLDFATDLVFSEVENLEGNLSSDRVEFASALLTFTTPRLDGTINLQGGIDTIDYSDHFSQFGIGVKVNLSVETATLTGGVSNIENVEGSRYDDILTGNSEDNILNGNDGDDFILGLQGADTLSGAIGLDILVGGIGGDVLDAGEDEDILIGGSINFGANVADLEDVMNDWQAAGNFLDRVNILRDGNGLDLVLGSTVDHDAAGDTLTGGTDALDWFFADNADTRTDPDESGEQITT